MGNGNKPIRFKARSAGGQLLALFDLIILIPCGIGLSLLILNTGLLTYYKQKLCIAANAGASYVARAPLSGSSAAAQVQSVVRQALREMDMPFANAAGANLDVSRQIQGQPAVTVTVTAPVNLLVPGGRQTLRISDTAVQVHENYVAMLAIKGARISRRQTIDRNIWVPCAAPSPSMMTPCWKLRYYAKGTRCFQWQRSGGGNCRIVAENGPMMMPCYGLAHPKRLVVGPRDSQPW